MLKTIEINGNSVPVSQINLFLGSNWSGHLEALQTVKDTHKGTCNIVSSYTGPTLLEFLCSHMGISIGKGAESCLCKVPELIAISNEISDAISSNSPIVILTPVGNNLHPDLHHTIWEYLEMLACTHGYQVFFSTYSSHVVSACGVSIHDWTLVTFPFAGNSDSVYTKELLKGWLSRYTLEDLYDKGELGGLVW